MTTVGALRGLAFAVVVLALVSLQPAKHTEAIYHIAFLGEVMAGIGDNPDAQFIEVRMDFPGQNLVDDTRLSVWNADGTELEELMILDHDVPNDGVDLRWLMATQAFVDLTGLTPDFIMPPGLVTPTGMVCWGGPDFAPPSDQWPPEYPFLYTDCVAYGGYTGDNSIHPPPTGLPAGDGSMSLTRIAPEPIGALAPGAAHLGAPPDVDAWELRCASPENNAGDVLLLGDDDDDDGLPNCHEGEQGTDPDNPDSDGDGFSDGDEFFAGSDPNDPNSIPGGPQPTATPGATPTPAPSISGDADGSGTVTSLDALLVLQFTADLLADLPCAVCADVTGDATINAVDASVILQYVAGLLSGL